MEPTILNHPFKFGIDPYPNWFKSMDPNKVKFHLKSDGSIDYAEILTDKRKLIVRKGEIIGLTGGQIIKLPAAASKYM